MFLKAGETGVPVRVFLLAFLCVNLALAFPRHPLCLSFCVRGAKWSRSESRDVVPAHGHRSPLLALKGEAGECELLEWASGSDFFKSSVP